jgi:hypothetical protein
VAGAVESCFVEERRGRPRTHHSFGSVARPSCRSWGLNKPSLRSITLLEVRSMSQKKAPRGNRAQGGVSGERSRFEGSHKRSGGEEEQGDRRAVPAIDIQETVLQMRGLLGTPGAGLEMSWCIQKPPDAAQEDNGGSRQLGPGVARERRANPKY